MQKPLTITTLEQYKQTLAELTHGNDAIEYSHRTVAVGQLHSSRELMLEAEALISRARALTAYMQRLCSMYDPNDEVDDPFVRGEQISALSRRMAEIRSQCDRFSATVTRIAAILEDRLPQKRYMSLSEMADIEYEKMMSKPRRPPRSPSISSMCSMCGANGWSRPCSAFDIPFTPASGISSSDVVSGCTLSEEVVPSYKGSASWVTTEATSNGVQSTEEGSCVGSADVFSDGKSSANWVTTERTSEDFQSTDEHPFSLGMWG